jgi:MFS family permease
VYLRGRFSLGQSTESLLYIVIAIGAPAGVLLAGRAADTLIHRGYIPGRVLVAGISFLVATVLFVPGLLVGVLATAVPVLFLAAARLDIMHPKLWGRAESVRTALRQAFQAIAPLLIGFLSGVLAPSSAALGEPSGPSAAGARAGVRLPDQPGDARRRGRAARLGPAELPAGRGHRGRLHPGHRFHRHGELR